MDKTDCLTPSKADTIEITAVCLGYEDICGSGALSIVLVAIAMCILSIEHDEAAPSDPSVVAQLARKEYSV